MSLNSTAIQDINRIKVLTDRVRKRQKEYLGAPVWISSARARSCMEAWKETEAEPVQIRHAIAFARILADSPVIIRDGELIVGSDTKYIRGAQVPVEHIPYDILAQLKQKHIEGLSEVITARIEKEDEDILEESARYWAGKSTQDIVRQAWKRDVGEEYFDLLDNGSRVIEAGTDLIGKGSTTFHPKVFQVGLLGIIRQAMAEKEKISQPLGQSSEILSSVYHRVTVLDSIIISCEAVNEFAARHASLARSLAQVEDDPVRKEELESIAERCERVPASPPRNFAEAVQSLWLTHLVLLKENPHPVGPSLGRLDQYLYPFYAKDFSQGKITPQEAGELLGCLWIKLNELEAFRGFSFNRVAAASLMQQITIGGTNKEGQDSTNDISYLILEVSRQMKMPQPGIYLAWHKDIDHNFLIKAAETNRDIQAGLPAFLNDQSAIQRSMALGVSLEDAVKWSAAGCLTYLISNGNIGLRELQGCLNVPKILEITLHNGVDPRTGKKVGLSTGDVSEFTRIEELYSAFEKQFAYFLDKMIRGHFVGFAARLEQYRAPFTSALIDDCLARGLDVMEGGERYPFMSVQYSHRGHVDVADCLAAIKKLIFEGKKLTMARLLQALAANFEGDGNAEIQKMCLNAPKYGNDDDYVDDIFNYISLKCNEIMISRRDPRTGKPLNISRPALTGHYYHGAVVGALPNGRKAFLPLYDAGLSCMGGADINGPTALINSATKVDHNPPESNGIVLNMKFSHQMLETAESIEKFLALLPIFFKRGGWHIQFNITNREDLIEAQKHPELWRQLIVRVAGYSAYFVDLPRDVQDEIIARTEHNL